MKTTFLYIILISILSLKLVAQDTSISSNWCASNTMLEKHLKKHPELRQKFIDYQTNLNNIQKTKELQRATSVTNYTIPVVFHVLHQNGIENISDAQIQDQIDVLNRDYNLQNTDTSIVIPPMKSAIGNIHFTFELAKLDPNGNCTSGINRYYDDKTNNWMGDWSDYIYTWPSSRYLNFYVVKKIDGGPAGYAYYPGSLSYDDPMDAILILHSYVGRIGTSAESHSRAITHEVGHWFNLQHVWGDSNNPGVACDDDQVFDTPITKGYTACSSENASKICDINISENYQNYMDYSYCSVMFTNGQGLRMHAAANDPAVGRDILVSTSNLTAAGINPIAACAPIANFISDKNTVCIGDSVTFSDISNAGTPTNWQWTFENGTPANSNIKNPSIKYYTPGTYSVQLISSNSIGNSPIVSKTNYITVLPSPTTNFMSEGFESGIFPNSQWTVRNNEPANLNWNLTNLSASTGNNSIYVDESIEANTSVEVYSPTFNFSAMPNLFITLKWAGSERDAASTTSDIFNVQFSTNCGATWSSRLTRYIKNGTVGVSPSVNGNFVPASNQYRQEVIPLVGLTNATNILFKLKFTSEEGSSNNFYVDDINITTTTDLKINEKVLNITSYPSPAKEKINIAFDLLEYKNFDIVVTDILGKELISFPKQKGMIGHHDYEVNTSNLSSGVYVLKINFEGTNYTQKLVIE